MAERERYARGWIKVWHSLISDARLQSCHPADRWLFIASLAVAVQERKGGSTEPVTEMGLASHAGLNHGVAAQAFARLEKSGVLKRSQGGGAVTIDADIFRDAAAIHGPYETMMVEGRRKKEDQGLDLLPLSDRLGTSNCQATEPKPAPVVGNGDGDPSDFGTWDEHGRCVSPPSRAAVALGARDPSASPGEAKPPPKEIAEAVWRLYHTRGEKPKSDAQLFAFYSAKRTESDKAMGQPSKSAAS